MRASRLALAVTIACISVIGAVSPAAAKQPTRGCPPAFEGPWTFAKIIDEFPPPPDFPDPEGALAAFDSNGDLMLCVRGLPGDEINVIDNIANPPV